MVGGPNLAPPAGRVCVYQSAVIGAKDLHWLGAGL